MMPLGRARLVWGAAQFFYLLRRNARHIACDCNIQGHDSGNPGRSIKPGPCPCSFPDMEEAMKKRNKTGHPPPEVPPNQPKPPPTPTPEITPSRPERPAEVPLAPPPGPPPSSPPEPIPPPVWD